MTSVGDPFSPRSSVGSASTDSSCLPRRRIRCSKTQITVGESRYESASDALHAYLRQFDQADGDVGASDKADQITTPRSKLAESAASGSSNGLVNGVHVVSKPPLAAAVLGSHQAKGSDPEGKAAGPWKPVGKGLAGSGLVLASHGIAVAGTREDVEDLLTSKVSQQHYFNLVQEKMPVS